MLHQRLEPLDDGLPAVLVGNAKLAHDDRQQVHAPEGWALLCGLKLAVWHGYVKLLVSHRRGVEIPAVSGSRLVNLDAGRGGGGKLIVRQVCDLEGHSLQTSQVFVRYACLLPALKRRLHKRE